MGCSAAKNIVVNPGETNEEDDKAPGRKERKSIRSTTNHSQDLELYPDEIENATVNNVQTTDNGLAFDITFEEMDDKVEASQKHLPKRIIELQESESKEPVTLEKLQEKLEEAEARRQQILQQRSQSANLLKRIRNNEMLESVGSEEELSSPNHLSVPSKK